jgi:hypothetical protein
MPSFSRLATVDLLLSIAEVNALKPNSSIARAKVALGTNFVEHGILPMVQRLAELLGMASMSSSAHYVIKRLREEGYLDFSENGKLTAGPASSKRRVSLQSPLNSSHSCPQAPGAPVLRVDAT